MMMVMVGITYDAVIFIGVTGLTSLKGFVVDGTQYNPFGFFYDSELILRGPGGWIYNNG
jgi:hypothetical protein